MPVPRSLKSVSKPVVFLSWWIVKVVNIILQTKPNFNLGAFGPGGPRVLLNRLSKPKAHPNIFAFAAKWFALPPSNKALIDHFRWFRRIQLRKIIASSYPILKSIVGACWTPLFKLQPSKFALLPCEKDHFRQFRKTFEWQWENGGNDVGLLTNPLPASFFEIESLNLLDMVMLQWLLAANQFPGFGN